MQQVGLVARLFRASAACLVGHIATFTQSADVTVLVARLGNRVCAVGRHTMRAKLGNVLYWTACTVAVLMLACAALVWFTEREAGDLVMIFNLILIGLGAWIIGGGCRYVLARA